MDAKYPTPPRYTHKEPYTGQAKIIQVYIDKNFDSKDDKGFAEVLADWNYVLNGYIKFEIATTSSDFTPDIIKKISYGHGMGILKVDRRCKFIPPTICSTCHTAAFTWRNNIFMVRDVLYEDGDDIRDLLRHEIGHYFGAGHISGKSVMSPIYDDDTREHYKCIDIFTIKEVAKYNKLDENKLNYCY